MTAGAFPLTAVGSLPNAHVVYPGEVWSNLRANGNIVPGAAVFPGAVSGRLAYKQIVTADAANFTKPEVGIAFRQVEIPDTNNGPSALGPNEIVNQLIASGDYLRVYLTGALALTLVEPRADYAPGDIIGWDPEAARPAGKAAGTGAWTNQSGGYVANTDIFTVIEPYRAYGEDDEGILVVKFLRSTV